jgi:DNA-binding HxlR family transcriptional regulator
VLEVIGGKYKVAILYHLRESVVRFGELHRLIRRIPIKNPWI